MKNVLNLRLIIFYIAAALLVGWLVSGLLSPRVQQVDTSVAERSRMSERLWQRIADFQH